MLTKLTIRNFKLFESVELELADRVVLIGPNNSGKTSALQALALWDIGVKRWSEKRGAEDVPSTRPGVTINRRDLITMPIPAAKLMWRDLRTQASGEGNDRKTIFIEIIAEGVSEGQEWASGLEFYYANEESFYCRTLRMPSGERMSVPKPAAAVRIAYLPPMSGLSATETRLDEGAIHVRLGEGRSAEVLRNLCYQVWAADKGGPGWQELVDRMKALFGIELDPPDYVRERGEIVMSYRSHGGGVKLDISAGGRGQQQTLLLLAHMTANPGSVLLLDEPDAHLEILRQRQIYQVLSDVAQRTRSQIIAASHSEVLLSEAADRDTVIAFVGKPHRIDDRGSQVLKSLREIGFEQYFQAEQTGWVLYLEGATDLAILRAFAERLDHPAKAALDRPFVHYVANQPRKAEEHFHALRDAKPDLQGVAIYDRLDPSPPANPHLMHATWRKRELENYLCRREALLGYARAKGFEQGSLFGEVWEAAMGGAIAEIEAALAALGRPSPWGDDIKASDDFLGPLFENFYAKLMLPNLMRKTNFHALAPFVPVEELEGEVREKLGLIAAMAEGARRSE